VITGHLGVAAAARGRWPIVPLIWLLPVAVAPDLLDLGYAILGICSPYGLYSHTIPAAVLTAAVLGGIAFLASGSRAAGLLVAGVVLAHLPLDLVTGYKIYWPGGPLLGLRLYGHPLLDFLAETPFVLAGWWLLRRTGRGPHWAVAGSTAAVLLLLQGAFDLVNRGLKPDACVWHADVDPGSRRTVLDQARRDSAAPAVYEPRTPVLAAVRITGGNRY
jgi:hypothetical protein